jgi:hypothetical protein
MIHGLSESGRLTFPSCRIGAAMGTIIASRTGNQLGEQDVFLGDALGVVDKILAATKPDQILVDEEIADRIVGAFKVRARDPNLEPRLGANQKVFAVEREVLAASRFDSRAGARLLKMIGRDEELTFMEKRWRTAKSGEGQAALLVGEAGLGKSRLIRAIVDEITKEPTGLPDSLRHASSRERRPGITKLPAVRRRTESRR